MHSRKESPVSGFMIPSLKACEGIRVEDFRPLVRIIGAGVPDGIAEKMPELPGNGGGSRFELGPIVLDHRFEGLLEIIVALDDQLTVEKQVHFA